MSKLFYNVMLDGTVISSGDTNFMTDLPELMHTVRKANTAHRMISVNNDCMNISMASPGFRAQQYLVIYCHLVHAKRVLTAWGCDDADSRLLKSLDRAIKWYKERVIEE